MKTVKKALAATVSVLMIMAVPGTAHATGYIRIGDECFVNMGTSQYPALVQIACPREVSENP